MTGVCLCPSNWHDPKNHYGDGVIFILEGAKDSGYKESGNAIFPETLKSEFHGIRSTIEAYSKKAIIGGYDEASACGVMFGKGGSSKIFEVISNGISAKYKIDRFD